METIKSAPREYYFCKTSLQYDLGIIGNKINQAEQQLQNPTRIDKDQKEV
jgi:hypothetical protein